MTLSIYTGSVMHHRHHPRVHHFSYPTYFLRIPLDDLGALDSRWMSVDRFNLFSFYRRDHGARDGSDLQAWIRGLLQQHGITTADGAIELHTYPRILGFVFNPVSFWYCHDKAGKVRAILAEVNNTFGEHHSYLLAHQDGRPIAEGEVMETGKVFHVSPFMEVAGQYRFRFHWSKGRILVHLDYWKEDRLMLSTAISGVPQPFTDRNLLRLLAQHGWMTAAVVWRIHWQALKLWAKRITFHHKPDLPKNEIS
jgi:DUF1365 family protein